jgi:hypothetical protein
MPIPQLVSIFHKEIGVTRQSVKMEEETKSNGEEQEKL